MWRKEAGFSFFRPFPAFPNPRICDILYPIGSVLTGERGMTEMAKPEAPVLETERLRLRRRQHRDIPRMMQAYQDDEIRRYLGGHPPKDAL